MRQWVRVMFPGRLLIFGVVVNELNVGAVVRVMPAVDVLGATVFENTSVGRVRHAAVVINMPIFGVVVNGRRLFRNAPIYERQLFKTLLYMSANFLVFRKIFSK